MTDTALVLIALTSIATAVCAQTSGRAPLPDDATGRCRYAAEHMIDVAKQSLADPNSRAERIAKRRKLVEDWTARMNRGEDPCLVYLDIQKAATTF